MLWWHLGLLLCIIQQKYCIFYVIAPYLLFTFFNQFGLPIIVSVIIAIIGTILLSLLIEILVYKPLDKKTAL